MDEKFSEQSAVNAVTHSSLQAHEGVPANLVNQFGPLKQWWNWFNY